MMIIKETDYGNDNGSGDGARDGPKGDGTGRPATFGPKEARLRRRRPLPLRARPPASDSRHRRGHLRRGFGPQLSARARGQRNKVIGDRIRGDGRWIPARRPIRRLEMIIIPNYPFVIIIMICTLIASWRRAADQRRAGAVRVGGGW